MTGTIFDVEVVASGGGKVLAFPNGASIHSRGDPGDCAYIVKSGRVELRQKGRAVETIDAGEIFGEACLLVNAPRLAGALAVGAVELLPIDRHMFDVLLRDDEDFVRTIVRRLAWRLHATTEMFERCVDEVSAHAGPPPPEYRPQGRQRAG